MFPVLFKFKTPDFLTFLFPEYISVYSYGLFIGLGTICCYLIVLKKTKSIGITYDNLSDLFILSFIAAFVGGKLLFYLEDPVKYFEKPSLMLKNIGSGFVFYGSLIFVIPTIIFKLSKLKIPIIKFFDGLAWGAPVLHSFGRIGCLMAGCCHGKVCNNFLGIIYSHPHSAAFPKNVPLYPTQLFDIAVNLVSLTVIFYYSKKQKFDGQLFLIYIIIYAIGRIIIENYRGDESRGFLFNDTVSYSQFIALLLIIVSIVIWNLRLKQTKS
ncbi:MAG: prolipoprotein diacylglyceryl transferase [Bacteroidia bacterium]|nr:prolipoprotein diacylglyceryl transferase [Bacteroidia bacterium]